MNAELEGCSPGGTMRWWGRNAREVRYSVSWTARDAQPGVFHTLCLRDGGLLRVMDKSVHTVALESAGRKLSYLRQKSGQREPSP
jgi:hypothetical protein